MFRELPAWEPDGSTEGQKIQTIEALANTMVLTKPDVDAKNFPAGYTFFGQFVDHDITFDPRSSLQKSNDPDNLEDFRSPAFDLDNIYGRGPDDQPYMYAKLDPLPNNLPDEDRSVLVLGEAKSSDPAVKPIAGGDLHRLNDTAVIGDMRNDENLIVSQMQLAFLKFHNKINEALKPRFPGKTDGGARFAEAQRIARWHYQWVVIHDWLTRLCGEELVTEILAGSGCPGTPKLWFYHFSEFPFLPVEFSVAAYRLPHSTMRESYTLNNGKKNVPLFQPQNVSTPDDLRGFQPVPTTKIIEWCHFLEFKGKPAPQMMRKIDRFLTQPVIELPNQIAPPVPTPGTNVPMPPADYAPNYIGRSLAFRNLLRGYRLGLPSGQSVARRIGAKDILPGDTPLWYYMLEEADKQQGGNRLGEVGARITAETFIGLLAADPSSYYSTYPGWRPDLETALQIPAEDPKNFQLRDIIKFSGAPI